jgi:hypothetical protein
VHDAGCLSQYLGRVRGVVRGSGPPEQQGKGLLGGRPSGWVLVQAAPQYRSQFGRYPGQVRLAGRDPVHHRNHVRGLEGCPPSGRIGDH